MSRTTEVTWAGGIGSRLQFGRGVGFFVSQSGSSDENLDVTAELRDMSGTMRTFRATPGVVYNDHFLQLALILNAGSTERLKAFVGIAEREGEKLAVPTVRAGSGAGATGGIVTTAAYLDSAAAPFLPTDQTGAGTPTDTITTPPPDGGLGVPVIGGRVVRVSARPVNAGAFFTGVGGFQAYIQNSRIRVAPGIPVWQRWPGGDLLIQSLTDVGGAGLAGDYAWVIPVQLGTDRVHWIPGKGRAGEPAAPGMSAGANVQWVEEVFS